MRASDSGSFKLGQRQCVTVRILKPNDQRAAGRVPDTIVVLSHAFVTLKSYASGAQMVHRPPNFRHGPAEHRVWDFVDAINLLNAQHRVADLKHQCWRFIRYES